MRELTIFFTASPSTQGDCHEQCLTSDPLDRQDLISFYQSGVKTCQLGVMTSSHQASAVATPQMASSTLKPNNFACLEELYPSFPSDCGQEMSLVPDFLFENADHTAAFECSFAPAGYWKVSDTSQDTLVPTKISNANLWPASFDEDHNYPGFSQNLVPNGVCFDVLGDEKSCGIPDNLYGSYLHYDDQSREVLSFSSMNPLQQKNEAKGEEWPPPAYFDITSETCKNEPTDQMSPASDVVNPKKDRQHISSLASIPDTNTQAGSSVSQVEAHSGTFSSSIVMPECQYNPASNMDNYGTRPTSQYQASYPPLPPFVPDFDIGSITFDSYSGYDKTPDLQQHMLGVSSLNADSFSDHATVLRGGFMSEGQHQYHVGIPSQCAQDRRESVFRDTSKDEFLLECRRQGLSYKEIKVKGGFEEAESTLRGRVRALTKPREARVRKPDWAEDDIAVLKETVDQFLRASIGNSLAASTYPHQHGARAQRHILNRIPWKQVAETMANRGCYHFGNATVKKKYMELMSK